MTKGSKAKTKRMMESETLPSGVTNLLGRLTPLMDKMDLPRPQRNLVTSKKGPLPVLSL